MKLNLRIGICIFAIAMAFGLNITGIMPVLGMVQERYSDQSTGVVQLMQTLPYGFLMLGSLSIGWFTARMSKKSIAMLAITIIGVCGVLPFVSDSFAVLFLSRLFIGFGFGLAGPIITAIIAEFIPPEGRAGFLGINVVGMGISAMVGNLTGGILAKMGLRYFYLVYLMAFVSLLVVFFLLPAGKASGAQEKSSQKLNSMVYIISAIAFLHTLFINVYTTNISMYIAQTITADPGAAGLATAVSSASSLLMGVMFGRMTGILKRATLPFAIFAAAAGFGAVLFIPGMAGAVISSFLCGASLSCFSAMGAYLMSIIVRPEAVAKASGMFSIIGGIGGLISPIVLGSAAAALLGGNTPGNQFTLALAGMLIVGAVMTIIVKYGIGEVEEQRQ